MSAIASLFTNNRMPSGLTAFCSSILARSISKSPVGGLVFGVASAVSFSLVEKLLNSHHPLLPTVTKTAAFAVPLIAAALGGWVAAAACGFKFSFSDVVFLGVTNPICIKIVLAVFDLFIKIYLAGMAEVEIGRRIAMGEEI